MSSSSNRNLVIVGGELWSEPARKLDTSFCKHLESEKKRAGRDIEAYSLHEIDLGMEGGELFLRLPDGTAFTKDSPNLPKWALLYVTPPRIAYMLEHMGIPCYSSYAISSTFNDKMMTHVLFSDIFPQPDTLFYGSDATIEDIVFSEDPYPFMLKGVSGQGGVNVERVGCSDEVFSFVDERGDATDLVMLQQAMPKADDVRVYCLGDEILGAVLRRPREGIWKANLEFGPKRERYELGREEERRIRQAMELLPETGRGLYSFDFLFDADGRLVLCEANCNVGTDGLDAAGLGKDLFLRYVDYIRREVQRAATERR